MKGGIVLQQALVKMSIVQTVEEAREFLLQIDE
jgi:hypothetical protein